MATLGVQILNRNAAPAAGAPVDSGVWFAAGITQKGPVDRAVSVRSLSEYESVFGTRQSYATVLYDAVDTFFKEGGGQVYVGRIVGPAPVLATVNLAGTAGTALIANASSAGDWANGASGGLTVQVIQGASGATYRQIVVRLNGVEVERSPEFTDNAAAIEWSATATYIRLVAGGGTGLVVVAAAANLASGSDDRASITDTQRQSAVDLFTAELGPGQVSMPGVTTSTVHAILLAAAVATNKVALLDASDTGAAATHTSTATSIAANRAYGGLFTPWVKVPGVTPGTLRTVPPSPVVAALCNRVDQTGNPNLAAAGRSWPLQYVVSFNNTYTDTERQTLLDAGVNTFKTVFGVMELYGFRTLAAPASEPIYWQLNRARTRMAISARAREIAERFMFAPIDGRGVTTGAFNTALTEMLTEYFRVGALYGAESEDAFAVDTGSAVNTEATIADGELRAAVSIRISPHAEGVVVETVSVPTSQAL